jgi:5'-nucleotidase
MLIEVKRFRAWTPPRCRTYRHIFEPVNRTYTRLAPLDPLAEYVWNVPAVAEYYMAMKTTNFGRNGLRFVGVAAVLLVAGIGLSSCSKEPPRTLTIAFSNDLNGEIRTCDCPGENLGGLGRRATFLASVRDTTGDFLLLDGGDIFSSEASFGVAKADVAIKSMAIMGYNGVVVGEKDFGFGVDYIVNSTSDAGLPVLAANVYDAKTNELLFAPSSKVEYPSGLRVGIIGVLGDLMTLPRQVPAGAVKVTDPVEAVEREVSAFQGGVDVVVVLAHLPLQKAKDLARRVRSIDVVVCGHEGRRLRKVEREGNAFVLQVPPDGWYGGVAFAVLGKEGGIRDLTAELTPLTARFEDHQAITELFSANGL